MACPRRPLNIDIQEKLKNILEEGFFFFFF